MSGAAVPDHVAGTLPSHPKYLPMVRAIVDEGAALAGFDDAERHKLVLAVTEAWTNVIRHVYGGATDRRIDYCVDPAPGRLDIRIEDYGTFVDPAQIESRPLDEVRPGGLGVHLIRSTMDEVDYSRNDHGGTTLTMVRRGAPTPEPTDAHSEERGSA